MCCAVALEDVELEVAGVATLTGGASGSGSRRWQARVQSMERHSLDLMRLHLALPAGQRIDFVAGQYINIVLADGAKRAFSFANAPPDPTATSSFGGDSIELHIRLIPGGRFTTHVFEGMQVGDSVEFEGPIGRFTLHESQRPILLVAGATGFAPVKSILEDAFRRGVQRPMTLYWGVRTVADLYLVDQVERWQREHANFRFVPVLSAADADAAWSGRRSLVHEAMLADHPDLRGHEVYACGSVRMVEAAVPDFIAHGLDEQFCFSDAFVPSSAPAGSRPTPETRTCSPQSATLKPHAAASLRGLPSAR
jgi:NAD(P)H-flavin reductase